MNNYRLYDFLLAAFVLTLVISNIAAVKLISFGPIITDGGAFLFPLAYILGDVITEVYGLKYIRRAVLAAFAGAIVASVVFYAVQLAPAGPGWENQAAFEAVLGFVPRIVAASLAAFAIGQLINATILDRMRRHTDHGERMWLRFISSSFVGQFFDTLVFGLIAFYGVITGMEFLNYFLVGWFFKVAVEVLVLPVSYRLVGYLRKHENLPVTGNSNA